MSGQGTPPESNPSQGNPPESSTGPDVSPADRINLELTEGQLDVLAQLLTGDTSPDWLVDLSYEVEHTVVTPGHVRRPPTFRPDSREEDEVLTRAQQDAEPVTGIRAFMLSPICTPVGDVAEQYERADLLALRQLAKNEVVRANLAYARAEVDKVNANIKAAQDAVDEATQRGDQMDLEIAQKALASAKAWLPTMERRCDAPQRAWDDLVVEYNEDTPDDARKLDPVIDAHLKVKVEAGKLVSAAKKSVTEWVTGVFKNIEDLNIIPAKPADFSAARGYVDTTLYIITMSEFAFNGWAYSAFGGPTEWNAAYPFHEDLETFIYEQIRKVLRDKYPHVRVLFAFSCCTYSSDLLFQVDLEGTKHLSDIPKRKLASANRITVVSSAGPLRPRRITQFEPSTIDGWTKEVEDESSDSEDEGIQEQKEFLFPETNLLNHSGERSIARFSEIIYKVKDHFGGKDESAVLAFATCLDVMIDDHHLEGAPLVNMCIYLGGGLSLPNITDGTHPFILNDVRSQRWPGDDLANKWAPGWYQFSPTAGQQNVAERWKATGKVVPEESVAWKLYWDSAVKNKGTATRTESRVSYCTKEIPLPVPPASLQ